MSRSRGDTSASEQVIDGGQRGRLYAGIGSRQTPTGALALIESIAARLARDGWVLRTGMSVGADQAFYRGARSGGGRVELYLPWPGFQSEARLEGEGEDVRELARPTDAAYELAARFYREWDRQSWDRLTAGERDLLARDGHQVLGDDLHSPANWIVCWTPDGGLDGNDPRAGGTGQALRIAHDRGIPVFNLARGEHARQLRDLGVST